MLHYSSYYPIVDRLGLIYFFNHIKEEIFAKSPLSNLIITMFASLYY